MVVLRVWGAVVEFSGALKLTVSGSKFWASKVSFLDGNYSGGGYMGAHVCVCTHMTVYLATCTH